MTTRHTHEVLIARDEIVAPPAPRACDDHSFELPTGIYVTMAIMFTGFVVVLGMAFRGEMAVSLGVIFFFIAAFFAVPSLFPGLARDSRSRALGWNEFMDKGIETATGRITGAGAAVLVLLLPFLILCFAVAVASIAAFT